MKQAAVKVAAGRAKPPAKPVPRRAAPAVAVKARPAAKKQAPAAAGVDAKAADAARSVKPRQKLVRDSFTMPKGDFELIATLKGRAVEGGRPAKKSELLRAGLQALAALKLPALIKALGALEPIKVGRPAKR
ncbi:MAG TPA: hypothetical protein VLI72_10545 [Methylibium sp.]|nr:hypothetical protein [Methylibium sp.]